MEQTSTTEIGIEPIVQEVGESITTNVVAEEQAKVLSDMTDPNLEESVLDKELNALEKTMNKSDRSVEKDRDYSVSEDGSITLLTQHMLEDQAAIDKEIYRYVDGSGDGFKTFSTILKHNDEKAEVLAKHYGYGNRWEMMADLEAIQSLPKEKAREAILKTFFDEPIAPVEEKKVYPVVEMKLAIRSYSQKNNIPETKLSNSAPFVNEYLRLVNAGLDKNIAIEAAIKLSGIKIIDDDEVVTPVNSVKESRGNTSELSPEILKILTQQP